MLRTFLAFIAFVTYFLACVALDVHCCFDRVFLTDPKLTRATVYVDADTGEVTFKSGVYDSVLGTAYGYYQNSLNETGWSVLEIQTNHQGRANSNTELMYAAGYLEGRLTAR